MVGMEISNQGSNSFLMGVAGIGASILLSLMGWMPLWVMFGVLVIAGCLYNTAFFATGIFGGFAAGTFAAMDWLPKWIYFTAIVLGALFLAVQIAGKYVNTGVGSE